MRPCQLLQIARFLVSGAVVFALAAFTVWDYDYSRREAESSLTEVARLMEEHTRTALLAGSLQLNRVADLVGDRPLKAIRGSERDWQSLKRIMADIPHADSFWVFDAKAELALSTLRPDGVTLNASDREYFTAVRDGADLFVSPRIWGKIYGGYYFAMSRPLKDNEGALKGVVQFSIKDSYFLDFYRTLRPEDGSSFAIIKTDGNLVARYPDMGEVAAPPMGATLSAMARDRSGNFRKVSTYDGVERIYAFRRVAGYPLIVVAGLPTDVVFAGWADRTYRNGALAAGILAAFLLLSWHLMRAFRREQESRAEAQSLLADKDVLFQEIHHRVKNNLQIISSFLTMQAVKADSATAEAVQESLDRIHSMGLVHQILYEQNEASEVSMDAYLHALADTTGQSYGAAERGITIAVETDGTCLPLDQAVPLALLANEALTNALKHAFPNGRKGHIRMGLKNNNGKVAFSISDDGIGLPAGGETKPGSGLGMHILSALARQLGGETVFATNGGTVIRVAFAV